MLTKLYKTFWTERFLNIFCFSIISLLVLGIVLSFLSNQPNTVKAGDFPAFYAAGKLYWLNSKALYDLNAQALIQQMTFKEDGFHVFAYPPFVAPFFTLFSFLSPGGAKALYLIVLLFCLILSARLLLKISEMPVSSWQLLALMFLFAPLTIGFIAGQNTAISLLIVCTTLFFFKKSKWLISGAALGFLNFKPQYSLIAVTVLFLLSHDKVKFLIGYLAVSLGQLLLTLLLVGHEGIISWLILLKSLGEMNNGSRENIIKMTSVLSIYKNFFDYSQALGFLLAICSLLLLLNILRVSYKEPAILCPMVVFISPQTGFYDLALILPFLLPLLFSSRSEFVWKFIVLSFVTYISMTAQLEFKIQMLPIASLILLTILLKDKAIRISHEVSTGR